MLTAAIVLFENDVEILSKAISSFLNVPLKKKLYLIDNSKSDRLKDYFKDPQIEYLFTGTNLGFGKGHNYILQKLKNESTYHIILNPDAYFEAEAVPLLIDYLNNDLTIGIIAPKILYSNGEFQKSIRKFPKIQDFVLRRLPFLQKIFSKSFNKGNYLDKDISKPLTVDAVSGCFQVFKTQVFIDIGGFDTRYFMYMEDIDICKKVHEFGFKVVYNPYATVFHTSAYGSKKQIKLLISHIQSIFKYFLKWNFK